MQKTVAPTLYRLLSKSLKGACTLAMVLLWLGCVHGTPTEEWAFAFTAVEAAKQVQASRYAPGLWFKADEAYKRGQKLNQEHDYGEARREFIKARGYAEKAESITRLKRFQNSEVL